MSVTRVNGYPLSQGSKVVGCAEVTGPSSYTQYTAPSTGGQDVQAFPTFGVKQVDFAWGGISADGTHRVEVVQVEASTVLGVSLARTQLVLKWYVIATGNEAGAGADLSGQTIRLRVEGDK